jgi:hypothetical protein
MLLAAILAFPLVGPVLHHMLVIGVGATLAGPLAEKSDLDWWSAAGCIAAARVGLAVAVGFVRRLIARLIAGAQKSDAVV